MWVSCSSDHKEVEPQYSHILGAMHIYCLRISYGNVAGWVPVTAGILNLS